MIAPTAGHTSSQPNFDFVRLLDLVRAEYLEMPGLRLTGREAQRLWALDTTTCDALLETLERTHFLRRSVCCIEQTAPLVIHYRTSRFGPQRRQLICVAAHDGGERAESI